MKNGWEGVATGMKPFHLVIFSETKALWLKRWKKRMNWREEPANSVAIRRMAGLSCRNGWGWELGCGGLFVFCLLFSCSVPVPVAEDDMREAYRASFFLDDDDATDRRKACDTPWMPIEVHQEQIEANAQHGYFPLLIQYRKDGHRKSTYIAKPNESFRSSARSGRIFERFAYWDEANRREGLVLLSLPIHGELVYSAVWVTPKDLFWARRELRRHGITPASYRPGDVKGADADR
ncbi:MAG: hypothetical protein AAGD22_14965 [Verrucomicrobiota bacterium]